MVMKNKLGITTSAELARVEEKLTKKAAKQLYDTGDIDKIEIGTFAGLVAIHKYLFQDVYEFAGEVRQVNLAKGSFTFAPVMYLQPSLAYIDQLPQSTFHEIIEKYVEMNIAHPFREGNGRSMRIWLDMILRHTLAKVIDWSKIEKEDYLLAMSRSPIKDTELKYLISHALTDDINAREVFLKGIDQSYYYEGYVIYNVADLD